MSVSTQAESNNNKKHHKQNQGSSSRARFNLDQRRRQVASLVAQSRTEDEIAHQLGVDQSTISRDIQALREESVNFVHNLAKSDLAFHFINPLGA
jgi:DNA-binding NarL/FixJ family response regulator